MSQELNQTGDFRGEICSYKLQEYKSGAVAIAVLVDIHDAWNSETQEWNDWREHYLQVPGYLFVIKKNGTLNDVQVAALVSHVGWDGNLESITAQTWQPTRCQFSVTANTYEGDVSYRIAWINAYDSRPGTSSIDPTRSKELQNKFGSQLRAVAGNAVRNSLTPATPLQTSTVTPTMEPEKTVDSETDVPF